MARSAELWDKQRRWFVGPRACKQSPRITNVCWCPLAFLSTLAIGVGLGTLLLGAEGHRASD